jgi:hypothetical protein
MTGSGWRVSTMEPARSCGQMDRSTEDSGDSARRTEAVSFTVLTVQFTLVSGWMESTTEWEPCRCPMAAYMRATL